MDRLDDPTNLDPMARFIYQVHEYLSGGLHYSSYQEKWILKQLVPNSMATESFKLAWDAINPSRYTMNCTSCRFEDLSQFRNALLSALYGNNNIFQLVTNYIKSCQFLTGNLMLPKRAWSWCYEQSVSTTFSASHITWQRTTRLLLLFSNYHHQHPTLSKSLRRPTYTHY